MLERQPPWIWSSRQHPIVKIAWQQPICTSGGIAWQLLLCSQIVFGVAMPSIIPLKSTDPCCDSKPYKTKLLANVDCKPCVLRQTRGGYWKQEGSAVPVAAAAVLRGLALMQTRGIEVGKVIRLPISVESFRDWSYVVDAGKRQLAKLPVETLIRAMKVQPDQHSVQHIYDAELMHLVAVSVTSLQTRHAVPVREDVWKATTVCSARKSFARIDVDIIC